MLSDLRFSFARMRAKLSSIFSISVNLKLFFAKLTVFNDTLFKMFIDRFLILFLCFKTAFDRTKMSFTIHSRRVYINKRVTLKARDIFTSFNHSGYYILTAVQSK